MHFLLLVLAGCLGWPLPSYSEVAAPPTASSPAGHWEGEIRLPSVPLAIRVDLETGAAATWTGKIDIPVQGLRGFKLGDVTVDGQKVAFEMPGIPGEPKFSGQLDKDAMRIAGDFTQAGQSFPFTLERKAKTAIPGETPSRGIPGKGLAGYWQGTLKPAPVIELRLALEITNAPEARFGGFMVSVDQGNARIPLTALTETNGAVHLECGSVGGVFNGKLNADGSELAGDWKQGAGVVPLTFKRLEKPLSFSRPQEPKKPYPYNEEEVVVENKSAQVKLAGTFTWPRSGRPHTAVVLLTGSGAQDRDEALMGHRPFLVLADHLTRYGIAVLRCDDRGFGKSTGDFLKATDADFVEDALACVAYLRGRKEVKQIGLIGHSEGGIIAPLAAVKSPEVSFIVLLAGVGLPMEHLLARQASDIGRVMGVGEAQLEKNAATQREVFRVLKEEKDQAARRKKIKDILHEQAAQFTDEQKNALGISDEMLEQQLRTLETPWFRELLAYDPAPTLRAVKCPVLALNGEKDLQVAAKENLEAIRKALEAGGNKCVTTSELPGLNHLFQTCTTGAIGEYAQIDETFSPKALSLISAWILGNWW